jgi:hypothetical protein
LRTIPPSPDQVWQQNTQQERIYQNNIFSVPITNNKFWQRNADAEALFAVRVAKLDVVISDIFICERLVRFREFDEVIVKGFQSLILCWIWSDLVRVEFQ